MQIDSELLAELNALTVTFGGNSNHAWNALDIANHSSVSPGGRTWLAPIETKKKQNQPWMIDRLFPLVPAQQYMGRFLSSFNEFPAGQRLASFSIDQVMESLKEGAALRH